MKLRLAVIAVALITSFGTVASADLIYVIGSGHEGISSAINNLNSLGQTVVNSNATLSDYSAYDQVWDLRFSTEMTPTHRTALDNYLQGGGRVYLSGENQAYEARNNSINVFLSEIGAGPVGLSGNTGANETQAFSNDGQVVNFPNTLDDLNIFYGRTVSAPGTGFLVTETASSSTLGTTVGWDFGDLPGGPNARMLIGYDVETFQYGGVDWTENVVTYLGASAIPEPGTAAWLALGLAGCVARIRRRRR